MIMKCQQDEASQPKDFILTVRKAPSWLLVEKGVVFLLLMFLSFFFPTDNGKLSLQ